MGECSICQIIENLHDIEKDYYIAELKTGYALVSNSWQCFKGYTLFICKECVDELHELPPDYRKDFLFDMSVVSEAIYSAFTPSKMNYELLGNTSRHLHWHLIPRYGTDPLPAKPIWSIDRDVINSITLKRAEIIEIRNKIQTSLQHLSKKYGIQCTVVGNKNA
jgi:diadenosine tetraphosphate (Ap4A) HIT family hydrolase